MNAGRQTDWVKIALAWTTGISVLLLLNGQSAPAWTSVATVSKLMPPAASQHAAMDSLSQVAASQQAGVATVPASTAAAADLNPIPFYIPQSQSYMRQLATSLNPVTDKLTYHFYDDLYAKVFEGPAPMRLRKLKVLEIGLGCDMGYGPGASAQLWARYFPNSEIWFAEFDAMCVQQYQDKITDLKLHVVTGDQADIPTLERWVQETGGNFDVIIDDGGHSVHQQFNSFWVLFAKALKPGGAYFIEDLQVARLHPWKSDQAPYMMNDVITNWLDSLLSTDHTVSFAKAKDLAWPQRAEAMYDTLPPGIKSMDCASGICQFIRCLSDDPFCLKPVKAPRSQT